jgi:16S rRNA (adenine1518-N6/adenine1519-N6)-dimethyltransferase
MPDFERGVARKRFGQHFLVDAFAVDQIIGATAPCAGEHVIEIGPGEGVLTGHLVASGAEILAIEIDRDLVAQLSTRFAAAPNFTLHSGDVLKFDFTTLPPVEGGWKVVGNLPYNISTPLIMRLLAYTTTFRRLVLMLQREVAERMAAPAGSRNYGRLSVMVQRRCSVRPILELGPDSFWPPPKVDSSVVELVPHGQALDESFEQHLADTVRQAFSARRKTIANALRGHIPASVFARAGIDPSARAEQLSVADFVHLAEVARGYHNSPPSLPDPAVR